jgi:hypothetical protein
LGDKTPHFFEVVLSHVVPPCINLMCKALTLLAVDTGFAHD